MDFTSVDINGKELNKIKSIRKADIEIGVTNTFELTFSSDEWKHNNTLNNMYYFFEEQTEVGGIIKSIKSITKKKQVIAGGYTWRGYLDKRILEPPAGLSHKEVSGEVHSIIRGLIDGLYNGLIKGSKEVSKFTVTNYRFSRYCTILKGIEDMLESVGARLVIRYIPTHFEGNVRIKGYVEVSATATRDLSKKVEFSESGRIHMVATSDDTGVNHLVCLGKGELTNRLIVHLYADKDGNIGRTQKLFGINEIAETYDYSNIENEDEMIKEGTKKLKEIRSKKKIEVAPDDINVDIGDVVGGQEEITGLSISKKITRIIYKIDTNGQYSKEYKVGD